MQIKDVRLEPFTSQIRCDRCGLLAANGEVEFYEMTCIDFKAGYGSIFGDGSNVQVDLCQHCLRFTLERWLRVIEPAPQERLLQKRLDLFDPKRHGGEFPTGADRSMQVPDDLPVQERQFLDDSVQVGRPGSATQTTDQHARSTSYLDVLEYSLRLFFAPVTGAFKGIWSEYRWLHQRERSRQLARKDKKIHEAKNKAS